MKQRIIVAFLTVVVFGAGFFGGLWSERHRPLPPPPAGLMAEFTTPPVAEKGPQAAQKKPVQNAAKPYDRAQLRAEIEKLQPQIDAYRARIEVIDNEYERAFAKVLTPEQRQVYDKRQADFLKARTERQAKDAASTSLTPLSDEEISKLRQRPFETIFWMVSTSPRLEQTVRDYKLDAAQQIATRELLVARRDKFLSLLDTTPIPTLKMKDLAPLMQRLGDPTKAPAKPAASN